jgi:hypothetical protein
LVQKVAPTSIAGWSSPVARQAHNLKAAGSNPAPATPSLSLRSVRPEGSNEKFHFVIFSSEGPKMLLCVQNRAATLQRIFFQNIEFSPD